MLYFSSYRLNMTLYFYGNQVEYLVEPKPHDINHLVLDGLVPEVEVSLRHRKLVEVVLLANITPLPR